MKQEEKELKELLIKDLCGRLPYRVKCQYYDICIGEYVDGIIEGFEREKYFHVDGICVEPVMGELKPYLFPMSSMTEEQKEDLLLTIVGKEGLKLFSVTKDGIISNDKAEQSFENFSLNNINFSNENIEAYIDWLNQHHFDFRGLIQKSLALDATNLNIY